MTTPNRLHRHMAQMVALEASIEKTLDQLSKQASDHPDVAALVRGINQERPSNYGSAAVQASLRTLQSCAHSAGMDLANCAL